MLLFFDTETSGLPRRWQAPITDLSNWPRLVQLAWILTDLDGNPIQSECRIVRPEGFRIDPGATRTHGITTARALREGEPLPEVLQSLEQALEQVKTVVAHNVSFDLAVVGAEFLRQQKVDPLSLRKAICTMREGTRHCRIPGRYGYKWPTLAELHEHLFQQSFADAHDALADCDACRRCFVKLKELKVLKV